MPPNYKDFRKLRESEKIGDLNVGRYDCFYLATGASGIIFYSPSEFSQVFLDKSDLENLQH